MEKNTPFEFEQLLLGEVKYKNIGVTEKTTPDAPGLSAERGITTKTGTQKSLNG